MANEIYKNENGELVVNKDEEELIIEHIIPNIEP